MPIVNRVRTIKSIIKYYSDGKSIGSAEVRCSRVFIKSSFHSHLLICHVPSAKVAIGIPCDIEITCKNMKIKNY